MTNHFAILKWAAGAKLSLPRKVEFDTAILLDLVDAHNLSGRFMQRIYENGRHLSWVTPELANGLKQLHAETKQQVARNITAFADLRNQLPDRTHIILIKGISTYILSEQEGTMRAGDIDLFSNNPNEVVQTLLGMGYTQTRAPFMHEIGEYTKATTEFDIHGHFPVYGYTQPLLESDLMPQNHAGIWQQSYHLQHSKISFDDLEQSSHYGRLPETSHVVVAGPNLLAIIICAHAFMNYTNIWSISHREKAYVRLSEIADLFSLAAHPSFSEEQFLAHVNRYQAYDSVEWAAAVAVSIFGKNPLPIQTSVRLGQPLPSDRFPRCLWWNFWASIPSKTEALLRTSWLSMDWLVKQIGANRLVFEKEQVVIYATFDTDSALPLERCITQRDKPIPLTIQIKRSENSLIIDLWVNTDVQVNTERVRVDFGNIASEWVYRTDDKHQTIVGSSVKAFFTDSDARYKLRLEFALELLGITQPNALSLALLIGVARQTAQGGLIDSTLIPLIIES